MVRGPLLPSVVATAEADSRQTLDARFTSLPRIRSERAAFDLHHPEVGSSDRASARKGVLEELLGDPDIRR